ncbi:MAG TPA: nitrous oxide reductase family maturation protein NosD [Candidatus Dormibacteraeota bacterium]|nr:nitrous oxide reductase family maturation protein NosD [Candidatus Dormibacteraeota bacterium]
MKRCHPFLVASLVTLSCWTIQSKTIIVRNSITESLAEAFNGDCVLVAGPRTFNEHVVVTNGVRLLGTNAPIIDAGGEGTPLILGAQNASASGLVLRNSGGDLTKLDSGILISADHVSVKNCRIENDCFGIYVRGANNCCIERNSILGVGALPASARGNGIHLWKAQRNSIIGNEIQNKRDGMYFSYADYNVIAGNQVSNTRFGIHYMYSHENQLLTNVLSRNAVGATLMFSRRALVEGNIVMANRRHGIVLKQFDNSKVIGNVICGQNRGLFVQQANQNRFEGNLIATNDIGLYLSNISEDNTFTGNAFIRNTDQVWQPPFESGQGRKGPNAFSEHGRGNYWSDYTGTDRNHDGIGDTPYHETDAFGYIVDRHPNARVFAMSPAVALLRKGEELMPVLDTEGVTDLAPLMTWPWPSNTPSLLTARR